MLHGAGRRDPQTPESSWFLRTYLSHFVKCGRWRTRCANSPFVSVGKILKTLHARHDCKKTPQRNRFSKFVIRPMTSSQICLGSCSKTHAKTYKESKRIGKKASLSLSCPNQANYMNGAGGYHGEPMQKMDLGQKEAASDWVVSWQQPAVLWINTCYHYPSGRKSGLVQG